MRKIAEVMTTDVISVSLTTPIIEVAHQMKSSGSEVVVVNEKGRFRGMITHRDIVTRAIARGTDPVVEPASSVMNVNRWALAPNDDLMQAVRLMIDTGSRVLPVVRNDRLLGIFTLGNLADESITLAAVVFQKTSAREGQGVRLPEEPALK